MKTDYSRRAASTPKKLWDCLGPDTAWAYTQPQASTQATDKITGMCACNIIVEITGLTVTQRVMGLVQFHQSNAKVSPSQ